MTLASKAQQYHITLFEEAVAASTGYVLVDLSDTTNFKHTGTDHIYVQKIYISTEKASNGAFDIYFGVVTEVDADNGSVHFFHVVHVEKVGNATDDADRFVFERDFTNAGNTDGINLDVKVVPEVAAGSEVPRYFLSDITHAGDGTWQTDTGLCSPAGAASGATGKPGAGDLVMWLEETADTGTIDFCVSVDYKTL